MRGRPARRLGLAAAVVLVLTALSVRALSRRFLFPAHAVERVAPPPDFAHLTAIAADGTVVHALELATPDAASVVVHFHNNRETAAHGEPLARALAQRGYGVVLAEFRGYGLASEEEPTEEGLYLDAEAILDELAARGLGPERIVLWGQSLGTGVAAEMARRRRGRALVLVAPYTSIPDLVTDVAPFVPAELLLPDAFDTRSKAGAISARTLVIHGDRDEIVPFWMGEALAHAIRGARLVRVVGGGHSDLFAREQKRLLAAVAAL